MAPLQPKDTNRPSRSLSSYKGSDATLTNKGNFSSSLKSTKALGARNNDRLPQYEPAERPTNESNPIVLDDETSDSDSDSAEEIEIKWNCNQIRTRITTYLNNTDTTLKAFQENLMVSPTSFRTFMRQSGPHAGSGTATYAAAHRFFSKREAAGLKMPRAPAKKKSPNNSNTTASSSNDNNNEDKFDVSTIHLDGESQGKVPIYDTCNDVRTKIERHLRDNKISQAAFARTISTCQGEHESPVQGRQITDFNRKGKSNPLAGNMSKAYYAAYVYFEKLRIKQGKKKTKKREEMEGEYGAEGVPRNVNMDGPVWTHKSERPYVDNLGRLTFG